MDINCYLNLIISPTATSKDSTMPGPMQMQDNTPTIAALTTVISFFLLLGTVTIIIACIVVIWKKKMAINQQRYSNNS